MIVNETNFYFILVEMMMMIKSLILLVVMLHETNGQIINKDILSKFCLFK